MPGTNSDGQNIESISRPGAANTAPSPMTDIMTPRRASFLGLPPELRRLIYHELLGGPCDSERAKHDHCCTAPLDLHGDLDGEISDNARCDCAIMETALITVNKLTCEGTLAYLRLHEPQYAEARFVLPGWSQNITDTSGNIYYVGVGFRNKRMQQTMERAVFVGDIYRTDCMTGAQMRSSDNFSKYFEKVTELMPSLKHVRLHLDITHPIEDHEFHYEKFHELLDLPNVRTIVLEMGCEHSDHPEYDMVELRESGRVIRARLKKVLVERAVELTKAVKITVAAIEDRDGEPEVDTTWPADWI